jgi:predicted amidophosphoribosyltransferase
MEEREVFLQDTWAAKKFVNAIKGDEINRYAEVPVPIGGTRKRLEDGNKDDALEWFAQMVSAKFTPRATPTILIPIPAHAATSVTLVKASRLWKLTDKVAQAFSCSPVAAIHWKTKLVSARQGGERDPIALKANTVVLKKHLGSGQVLLLDDVVTSAGHLVGCASALSDAGFEIVGALCVGRTVAEQSDRPFSWDLRKYTLI